MGNTNNKNSEHRRQNQFIHSNRDGQAFISQFSLSHFVGNLSGRSFVSVTSNQSVYSASRPWSRVSRRRWNESTLKNPLEATKTAWPVAHKESIFQPEFPITTNLLQKDFQIQEIIAKGAFSEVYRVQKISEGKEYALKVLSKSQIVKESAVRQVKDEARIQAACGHHTFIAGAVARWQTKKRLYIVSEYVSGGELLCLLDKYGRLPEELAKIFIAEIALAVDFLHNAGVIYRDLKPENILLDSDYHIQLIDFGLSKWLPIGSGTTTLCGTIKYMAPEVLSDEPYGHAVDWWSLGVLACRMLTDKYPTPVVIKRATEGNTNSPRSTDEVTNGRNLTSLNDNSFKKGAQHRIQTAAGTLPDNASTLSNAARGLLMRLLERDPRVRMRNLRQLQQSAFYMGYNFEHVKEKKISPRSIINKHFEEKIDEDKILSLTTENSFPSFDQPTLV